MLASLAVSSASIFWGFSYVFTKFALAEVNPIALLSIRILFATLLFVLNFILSGTSIKTVFKYWPQAIPLAITGVLMSQLGYLLGLSYTSPSHGSLIYALLPIFTAIIAAIKLHERLSPKKIVGITIAFSGTALLTVEKGLDFSSRFFVGDLIMMGAVIGWASYTVLSKKMVEEIGTRKTLTLTYICSIPIVIPFTFMPALEQQWERVSGTAWLAIVYLILFATVFTVQLFTYALKHLSPTTVSVFVYVQPVVASVASVFILGEVLSQNFYFATVLIFSGLMIFMFKGREKLVNQRVIN